MPRRALLSRAATTALTALALAAPFGRAAAQPFVADSAITTAPAAVAPAPAAPAPAGPTLEGARAGATRSASAATATATAPVQGPRAGRPVALMAVGGAAIVLGAIIGGDGGKAVSIGGVIVGALGLYEFLR